MEQKVESRLANLGKSLEYMDKKSMAAVAYEGANEIAKLREALKEISGSLRGDTPLTKEIKRIADEALEETESK